MQICRVFSIFPFWATKYNAGNWRKLLFFPDVTLETLDSLFEGVYEILEVQFTSAMLWDLWYDIDSFIGTWERFGEFSKLSTIQFERLNRIMAHSGLS